jgi:hypothetical protein
MRIKDGIKIRIYKQRIYKQIFTYYTSKFEISLCFHKSSLFIIYQPFQEIYLNFYTN